MGKHKKKYKVTIGIWAWNLDDAISRARSIFKELISVESDYGDRYLEESWEEPPK